MLLAPVALGQGQGNGHGKDKKVATDPTAPSEPTDPGTDGSTTPTDTTTDPAPDTTSTEPAPEPAPSEPATEPASEPATDPSTEPASDPTTEPAPSDPATTASDPTTEPAPSDPATTASEPATADATSAATDTQASATHDPTISSAPATPASDAPVTDAPPATTSPSSSGAEQADSADSRPASGPTAAAPSEGLSTATLHTISQWVLIAAGIVALGIMIIARRQVKRIAGHTFVATRALGIIMVARCMPRIPAIIGPLPAGANLMAERQRGHVIAVGLAPRRYGHPDAKLAAHPKAAHVLLAPLGREIADRALGGELLAKAIKDHAAGRERQWTAEVRRMLKIGLLARFSKGGEEKFQPTDLLFELRGERDTTFKAPTARPQENHIEYGSV